MRWEHPWKKKKKEEDFTLSPHAACPVISFNVPMIFWFDLTENPHYDSPVTNECHMPEMECLPRLKYFTAMPNNTTTSGAVKLPTSNFGLALSRKRNELRRVFCRYHTSRNQLNQITKSIVSVLRMPLSAENVINSTFSNFWLLTLPRLCWK